MINMRLEVDVIPVSDVERSKQFYERLGWRLDADDAPTNDVRIVQFTPPGSGCSVTFGKGITAAAPGSAEAALVVSDIEAAHNELTGRGVDASEVWHGPAFPREARLRGPDPKRTSYGSFFSFNDPDGNAWLVQEVTTRLPASAADWRARTVLRLDLACAHPSPTLAALARALLALREKGILHVGDANRASRPINPSPAAP